MGEFWKRFWEAIGEDIADPWGLVRVALRLVIAAAMGGLLGYERARRGRPAGLRTHMLVAVGSAAYVLVPQEAGMAVADLSRVIQGLLTGIGFLGGGAILKARDRPQARGLTTAAGLWVTAAMGMAVGMGRPATAALITALALVILSPLRRIETKVEEKKSTGESPTP